MEKSIVSYPIKTNSKFRTIYTYANSKAGESLRNKHKLFTNKYGKELTANNDISFAYQEGKSVKHCVERHLSSKYFLSLDIKNFFNSIDLNLLSEKLSTLLEDETIDFIVSTTKIQNSGKGVAIGLTPSPLLANFYLSQFDIALDNFCKFKNPNLTYTRYADDIMISGTTPFEKDELIAHIQKLLAQENLELNQKKIKYHELSKHHDYVRFLGLNIVRGKEDNYLTVSRSFKKATYFEKNKERKSGMEAYINYNQER